MLPLRKSLCQFALFLILPFSQILFSQEERVPSDDDLTIIPTVGRNTFNSSCAGCHGLDGRGSEKAANISTGARAQHLSDAQLASIISNGVPGTGMPAFPNLSAKQTRGIVDYMRLLQGRVDGATVPGDAKRGRAIFFGKGDCSSCHTISSQGGFLGPDLTSHVATLSAAAIRNEIVMSPRVPRLGYRTAVVITASGDRLEGVVRNEDNFSVQLQTKDGNFHLLKKADLRSCESLNSSLMPANYRDRLSDGELDDLVSYLITTSRE